MAIIRVLKETMRFWTFRTGSVLRKLLFGSVVLSLVSCWILVYHTTTDSKLVKRVATFPEEKCQHPRLIGRFPGGPREHLAVLGYNASLEVERRILIVSRKTSITFRSEISPTVEAQRIAHQYIYVQLGEKVLIPDLMGDGMGRFSVIIFESIKLYLSLEKPLRELFEGYCRKFAVGFVYFAGYENYGPTPRVIEALHLRIQRGSSNLRNIELNPKSCLLRLTRAGGIAEMSPTMEWSVFFSNHSTYEAVEFAVKEISLTNHEFDEPAHHASNRYTTVLADLGYLDGIRRVYFGGGVSFWLHKLLFIDSLAFLSRGQLSHSLDRKFVVDVDDIFVGRSGIRMTKDDVKVRPISLYFMYFVQVLSNLTFHILVV